MELELVVQKELDALVKEGAVEKIIRATLEKTIQSIIQDVLRDYSDFGKELKKAVASAMNIDFNQMKIMDYNHIVMGIVREQLDKTLYAEAIKPISENLKQYIGGLDKKEWKLSEIIAEFAKECGENGQFEITLEVEESHGFTHIYFDEEKAKRKYDCGYNINIYKDQIYGFKAGKYNTVLHSVDLKKESMHGAFNEFIFRLYACGATIEVDEDDCLTESYD